MASDSRNETHRSVLSDQVADLVSFDSYMPQPWYPAFSSSQFCGTQATFSSAIANFAMENLHAKIFFCYGNLKSETSLNPNDALVLLMEQYQYNLLPYLILFKTLQLK